MKSSSNSHRFLARWIASNRRKSQGSRASYATRKLAPMVEVVESRQLMCSSVTSGAGLIAGTAFIDQNHDGQLGGGDGYLAGATIQLYKAGQCTPLRQTKTDCFGAYSFEGLAPGDYVLKEIPPCGYATTSTQILSDLNDATAGSCNTIKVSVADPNAVYNNYQGIQDGKYAVAQIKINLGEPQINAFGPMTVTLGKTAGASDLSGEFTTFCVDDLQSVSFEGGESWKVTPSATVAITGNADTAGRIGYLFNHYGNSSLTNVSGPALQLAIWELIYDGDANPDFWAGDFQLDSDIQTVGGADPDAILAQARQFYLESAGKREAVTFLKTATTDLVGQQSMLAHGSYDFGNTPTCTDIHHRCGTGSFWGCDDGQGLIKCFDGGGGSTRLGDWLAGCYPNLFGHGKNGCDNPCDVKGKTNKEVADLFKKLSDSCKGQFSTECDVFATALSQYACTTSLGGRYGRDHGFRVSDCGFDNIHVNVGCTGDAFNVPHCSYQSVSNLLKWVDGGSCNGRVDGGSTCRATKVGSLFSYLNGKGSIRPGC